MARECSERGSSTLRARGRRSRRGGPGGGAAKGRPLRRRGGRPRSTARLEGRGPMPPPPRLAINDGRRGRREEKGVSDPLRGSERATEARGRRLAGGKCASGPVAPRPRGPPGARGDPAHAPTWLSWVVVEKRPPARDQPRCVVTRCLRVATPRRGAPRSGTLRAPTGSR